MPVLLALLAHPTTLFALANLKRDLAAIWGWLCHRSFWQLMFGAALIFAGWEYLGKRSEQRHSAKVEAQLAKTIKARLEDRAAYVKAQLDAATKNKAQVAAVEAQQQKVTDNVETRYRADLERLRAASAAPQRPTGKSGSPAPVASPAGPACETVSLPPAELLLAQETELQLNALIDEVTQQSAIDPNKP